MIRLLRFLSTLFTVTLRTRLSLQLEVATLRHQLSVYQVERRKPRISSADRLLWSLMSQCWADWRKALFLVQPRTVLEWQKKRFRDYWRVLSQSRKPGRPKTTRELLDHVIVLSERHLKRLLSSYLDYYHPWRTHRSLAGDSPDHWPVRPATPGRVIEFPAVQGLHHYYLPKAA